MVHSAIANHPTYLHQEFTVLLNGLVRLINLLFLLGLYRDIQIDPYLLILEVVVERELGIFAIGCAFWLLEQDLRLHEYPERWVQRVLCQLSCFLDVFVGVDVLLIEEQETWKV
jgi:hypothetical protein